ncbi:hypothetical protein F2P81_003941 [Scophthalmus maximus]|uniref:Uncharacterized protein n=1 Tax=Scophthalmus maximus TaxID=52904 RepID=A0A6A4TFJ9_SCOMX|nr:hypothetical protein F2P81_003941 [Scophthalmus maximus]
MYKGHYEYQYVDSMHVRQALQFLKETNLHYGDIEFNEAWLNEFCREEDDEVEEDGTDGRVEGAEASADVVEDEVVVNQVNEDVDGGEAPIDGGEDELLHDREQHCMFQDTCLMPVDIGQEALGQYFDDILNVAPAEGNNPVQLLIDHNNEAKCFPVLFPKGRFAFYEVGRIV